MQFELGSEGRKPLIKAVSEVMGTAPRYLGAPTFRYDVGGVIIDKDGELDVPDSVDATALVNGLEEKGFARKNEGTRFAIALPSDDMDENAFCNLLKLIESKAALIMKALGADDLSVERTEDKLSFDWFAAVPAPEEIHAYTLFISALCEQAKTQQRVTGKAAPVENEKYAFRCFLLKLGFIGDEYKEARKILLSRLSGNSAFKSGKPEA